MSAKPSATKTASAATARPVYELRATGKSGGEMALAIWELPSPATPRLTQPERIAGLEGRNLQYVETRVLRRLRHLGISLAGVKKDDAKCFPLEEDLALNLALMFRTLAPMHSERRIFAVAEGIEKLTREEAGYWMGMAIHRVNPRRVLAALRILLMA
jgi:hypothetical protein